MSCWMLNRLALAAALLGLVSVAPVWAQVPASPEASEIAACLCLRQSMDASGAEMAAKRRSFDATNAELGDLDARLNAARASVDVNNPQSVAQFRQLLEQRDAVFRRSTGATAADLAGVTDRYNQQVGEYNARCANRPRNADLIARVQATLACPRPY